MSITFATNETKHKDFSLTPTGGVPGYHYIHLPQKSNFVTWDGPPMTVAEAIANLQGSRQVYYWSGTMWVICPLDYILNPGKQYTINLNIYPQDWLVPDYVIPKFEPYSFLGLAYHYASQSFAPKSIRGRIGNLSVSKTKEGMAGIEQDIEIARISGTPVVIEICAWYYGGYWERDMEFGCAVTAPNYAKRVKISPSEWLFYEAVIQPSDGSVNIAIRNSSGVALIQQRFFIGAHHIYMPNTYIEYWRLMPVPEGTFNFRGYEIIEDIDGYKPTERLTANSPQDFWDTPHIAHLSHYVEDSNYVNMGEVID